MISPPSHDVIGSRSWTPVFQDSLNPTEDGGFPTEGNLPRPLSSASGRSDTSQKTFVSEVSFGRPKSRLDVTAYNDVTADNDVTVDNDVTADRFVTEVRPKSSLERSESHEGEKKYLSRPKSSLDRLQTLNDEEFKNNSNSNNETFSTKNSNNEIFSTTLNRSLSFSSVKNIEKQATRALYDLTSDDKQAVECETGDK